MNPTTTKTNTASQPSSFPATLRPEKISPRHLERLAIVYVRQSTREQVVRHQESTKVQYGLKVRAAQLGWLPEQVVVVDDDQGQSGACAESRLGFQRVVSEVTLGRVGIILGVETSRLARSCDDWYPLLKVCSVFGTLIGDLDGVYDPGQYNDRLLLGLKGTMNEAELHLIKQRMHQGQVSKARRGELFTRLPIGYVRRPSGEVGLDPDGQVQEIVRLVFRKFQEAGTQNGVLQYFVRNKLQFGHRALSGPSKGELEWRRPVRTTIYNILKNPIYAGAYVYGRHVVDPRWRIREHSGARIKHVPLDACQVVLRDRLPAYITWEEYENNQSRLQTNRSAWDQKGACRNGTALLTGVVVCSKCGRRMGATYSGTARHRYSCSTAYVAHGQEACQGLSGAVLDAFVRDRLLQALRPSSLEVSMEAANNLERERKELDQQWQCRLERATYAADRAARHVRSVDPENRLVARQLESEWEERLKDLKRLTEDYERFERNAPSLLTEEERRRIREMAEDLPTLWNAPTTTDAERKEILRQVIDRVVVDATAKTETVNLEIRWAGGSITRETLVRPVTRLDRLSTYPQLVAIIREGVSDGLSSREIADRLNEAGIRPPKRCAKYSGGAVLRLIQRLGIRTPRKYDLRRNGLGPHEWRLSHLAQRLAMPTGTLYHWLQRGRLKARRIEGENAWAVWADEQEIARLEGISKVPHEIRCRPDWVKRLSDDIGEAHPRKNGGNPQEA